MSKFEVGEVAIVTWSLIPECPVGSEVTILAIQDPPPFRDNIYLISRQHGISIYASDRCLRKKRPPSDWVKLCKLDEVRPSVPREFA